MVRMMTTLVLASIVIGSLAGCRARKVATPSPVPEIKRCSKATDCAAGIECGEGFCLDGDFYLLDDTDAGNDIWEGGCHWRFTDAACAAEKDFLEGDVCTEGPNIKEWTNPVCHPPEGDVAMWDCNVECQKKGFASGVCTPLPDRCGPGRPSAKCECTKVES